MNFQDLPKDIRDKYTAVQQGSIRSITHHPGGSGARGDRPEAYTIRHLAMGAVERWEFIGQRGARRWAKR